MEERITQTSAGISEERQEATFRPQYLDDFIGQKNVKENLKDLDLTILRLKRVAQAWMIH